MKDLHAGYGPIEVLKGISLEVEPGEIVAIIGANGAGKTSTLMSISGCLPPARRRDCLRRTGDRADCRRTKSCGSGICHSPEGRKIFPRLTVLENLQMGAFTRRDTAGIEQDIERVVRAVSDSRSSASIAEPAARSRAASSKCWPWPAP